MSAIESAVSQTAVPGVPAAGAGASATSGARPSESDVWNALRDVHDPEIPAISVVDLGVIGSVEVDAAAIRVEVLPTFVGCPAIELMRAQIAERLAPLAERVDVDVSFAEPWTSDRITPEGRARLEASGFAPPVRSAGAPQLLALVPAAACPFCGSRRTVLENAFGPTLCRSIYYCTDCRQPFEQFKSI